MQAVYASQAMDSCTIGHRCSRPGWMPAMQAGHGRFAKKISIGGKKVSVALGGKQVSMALGGKQVSVAPGGKQVSMAHS